MASNSKIDFDKLSRLMLAETDDELLRKCYDEQNFNFSDTDFIKTPRPKPKNVNDTELRPEFAEISSFFKKLDHELTSVQHHQKTRKIKELANKPFSSSMFNLSMMSRTTNSTFKIPQPRKEAATDFDDDINSLKSFGIRSHNDDFSNMSGIITTLNEKQQLNKIFSDYMEFQKLYDLVQRKIHLSSDKYHRYCKELEKIRKFSSDLKRLAPREDVGIEAFTGEEEEKIQEINKAIFLFLFIYENQDLYEIVEDLFKTNLETIMPTLNSLLLSVPLM